MEKYQFDCQTKETLEKMRVPLAVYQFINKRVVTLILSDGFCDLFGFNDKEEAYYIMDNDMYEATHPDDKARIADEAYRFATEGGKYDVAYRTLCKDRTKYKIVHSIGEHVYTEDGVRLAYIWYTDEGNYTADGEIQDATLTSAFGRVLREEGMKNTIRYDYLTGLPSMFYFFILADEVRREKLSKGESVALIFLDLCGMKFFNRKYSFAEGDKLLIRFADTLRLHFSNESCSRFDSDHFCVITEPEGLEDKLRAIFSEFSGKKTLPVHVGIYVDKKGDFEISAECDRAKYACDTMRNAYSSNFQYFDKDMLHNTESRSYIIDHVDKAIKKGWIQVYHQPIIRSANGRVCNEEALARWIDPVKGALLPCDFIPSLEKADLIYKIDLYVVEQILDKMKRQAQHGLYLVPESVNVSRSDFYTCDIVEEIRKRVDAAGIERSMVNIEITESTVGKDFEFMKAQIERFQSLGFNVWMDDFGSGYSSLDVLQRIHFDLIKFDMRFMKEFSSGTRSRIMLTELTRMAISLGIDTVCEGVETREQTEFLRDIGCTMMQGYYFCRPITTEKIFQRYKKSIQIGFENPDESDYYASIGKVNLYDLAILTNEDKEAFEHYFNTIPMAVIESSSDSIMLMRCNNTCRDFLRNSMGNLPLGARVSDSFFTEKTGKRILRSIRECSASGNKLMLDEEAPDGSVFHLFIKRIAVNPVKNTSAVVLAVLAFTSAENAPITLMHIAKAFFADYTRLYYVNLLTGKFVRYSSDFSADELVIKSRGTGFFEKINAETFKRISPEEKERFNEAFTQDNIISQITSRGAFTLSLRLKDGSEANIKAVRIKANSRHIIIGFTDPGERGDN